MTEPRDTTLRAGFHHWDGHKAVFLLREPTPDETGYVTVTNPQDVRKASLHKPTGGKFKDCILVRRPDGSYEFEQVRT